MDRRKRFFYEERQFLSQDFEDTFHAYENHELMVISLQPFQRLLAPHIQGHYLFL